MRSCKDDRAEYDVEDPDAEIAEPPLQRRKSPPSSRSAELPSDDEEQTAEYNEQLQQTRRSPQRRKALATAGCAFPLLFRMGTWPVESDYPLEGPARRGT